MPDTARAAYNREANMRNHSMLLCSIVMVGVACADQPMPTAVESEGARPSLLTTGGYSIVDLGTLRGGTMSRANDINASGVVVGWGDVSGGYHRAFRWTGGDMKNLGTLPGFPNSSANGINTSGTIVGSAASVAEERALLWKPDGTRVDLGHLDVPGWTVATAVNDKNVVVGYSLRDVGPPWSSMMKTHAFRALPDGSKLGLSVALDYSAAHDINNRGMIAGSAGALGSEHAYIWSSSGVGVDLGTLGGAWAEAYAISDVMVVVGVSETASAEIHGFRWTPATGMVDLGLVNDNWLAVDVNHFGRIVGNRFGGVMDGKQGFMRVPAGFAFLDGLIANGPRTTSAVNRCGWIVGQAKSAAGPMHAVLWRKSVCDA